jgi:hypothetical protein
LENIEAVNKIISTLSLVTVPCPKWKEERCDDQLSGMLIQVPTPSEEHNGIDWEDRLTMTPRFA